MVQVEKTQYRVLTLRKFKEEIEGTMLNLLVMPMKNNPTLALLTPFLQRR